MESVKRTILSGIVLQWMLAQGLCQVVEHKWSIEGHIGGSFSIDQTAGTGVIFPRARDFTALNGQPSRRVTSWYFGTVPCS